MRVVVRSVSLVLAAAAVVVVAVAWSATDPTLDAADAADVAVESLASAGHDGVVSGPVVRGEHRTESGDVLPVWIVHADVDEGDRTDTIELRVQRSAGHVVYVDDRIGTAQHEQLLSDDEFTRLGDYEDDSYADRWALQNGLGSVSAVAVVAVGLVLNRRTDSLWRRS